MAELSKTVLVTGATGGIGTAVCERLSRAGYELVLAARDAARLEALATRLSEGGGTRPISLPVDMTDDSSVGQFAAALLERGIELDGAVLMPPQPPPTPEAMPAAETWRALFQASFIGPLAVLKAAIGAMQSDPAAGRRAKIVIVSGISSVQVLGHYATANVIRCAWLAEAKTLAFALGERGIHVNTLSLGGTLSDHYLGLIAKRASAAGVSVEERIAAETENVPLRKYGLPEEAAAAIHGLLSDFSDHITGVNILHDGGFTRAY